MTILAREPEPAGGAAGGLEIQEAGGQWRAVASPAGTLTVNIGDLLARWTNDRWRATLHRVRAPDPPAGAARSPGRLSMAYFTGPHPETVVECLPSAKCRCVLPVHGAQLFCMEQISAEQLRAKLAGSLTLLLQAARRPAKVRADHSGRERRGQAQRRGRPVTLVAVR